ncbi:MAG: penicillin-binding protein 2 [Bacteroidia bacterium]
MDLRYSDRKLVIGGVIVVTSIIFLIRLFFLQVMDDSYKLSAENNVLRHMTEYPARGLVYDRNGKLLVYNEAYYDLMVIPKQIADLDTLDFCNTLGITVEDFKQRMEKIKAYSKFKPSVFEKQLSSEFYAMLQEKLHHYKGFFTQTRTLRKYPSRVAAHLLGYVGEVDDRMTKNNQYYKSGDYIGVSGIEKHYEEYLRGEKGDKVMMVDVYNRPKGSFKDGEYDKLPVSGLDLISTIDRDLQAYAERLMQNKIGSVVAIEPSTGEILVLATSPTYDPNLLVGRVRSENYALLAKDVTKPLFNRALMAQYPPGSTFKLVNNLIGQQEKVVFPQTSIGCRMGYHAGPIRVGCHQHPSPLNLMQSVQHSCNAYYCTVFRSILDNKKTVRENYDIWRKHVMSFGFGKKFNTDLPSELKGLIPTGDYYDKIYGKNRWKSLTVVSLSIGQGELGTTPLQLANLVAILANRGFYYPPHLVKKIGNKKIENEFTTRNYTTIDSQYFQIVIDGMEQVVEAGTAARSKLKGIPYCGKTGTAQNPHGEDHSVFVCFAPKDNPKIALAVFVENSGKGGTYAAPIASLLIEKYLTDSLRRPLVEEFILNANLMPKQEDVKLKIKKETPID